MIKEQEVDSFFNRMVEDCKFSTAVLIADRSGNVLKGRYGQANDASGAPVTPDTIFDIGSISKQFTATALGWQ